MASRIDKNRVLIDLLIEKGPALQKAGYSGVVRLAGCELFLLPPSGAMGQKVEQEFYPDPLDDPDTFGGRMPGYQRLRQRDEGAQ